ncbi:hypothetical protein Tco_0135904, partial [Tanacetum coccineum]
EVDKIHLVGVIIIFCIVFGEITFIWETAETSDDDFWKNQEDWEIIRWRFHESSGVHTLELEDGTMIQPSKKPKLRTETIDELRNYLRVVDFEKNAMINPKQTWRPKGNYLDSVNRDNGSYTLTRTSCLILKNSKVVMWLLEMILKEEESREKEPSGQSR